MEQKQYEVLCGFMEHLTKDYLWYYDTPEQRFKYTPKSIWLINPETKEWVVELQKEGKLWWYWDFYLNFQRYFNMEVPDFKKFITIWVEDVINRGVSSTWPGNLKSIPEVEDVINRGVSSTKGVDFPRIVVVEDVINRGVSSTPSRGSCRGRAVVDVLNHGKTLQ